MIQELLYTADSKGGLKGGGSGYSTVLSTEGMASNLAQALERLSGYKHPFDIHDPRSKQITVNFRHVKIKVGGITYHVLSRIADLRHENTSRSNKLAHHVVLSNSDLPVGGPSYLLAHQGFCRTDWDGQVTLVPVIPVSSLPRDDLPARPCLHWKAAASDAGWAGFVAEQLHLKPQNSVNVIFPLGTDTLALTNEVFSLLSHKKRWEVTFSTYFTTLPAGTFCSLRFYLDGTSAADNLRRDYRQTIVDLVEPLGNPEESDWVQRARTGEVRNPEKHSKVADRPASELEDEGDQEPLVVEEVAPQQSELTNLDQATESLVPLPPPSRPLSTLQDSTPQGMGTGHTMTDFQRKLRSRNRRKVFLIGTSVALVLALLIGGGILFGSILKGLSDRQEANNQAPSGEEEFSNKTNPPPVKEIAGKSPQKKSEKTGPVASGESSTSESSPEPMEETDKGGSGPSTGDKSSLKKNNDTRTTDEVTPIELTLDLPYLKSPGKGGDAKRIEVELPKDWLSEGCEVNISQIGLDKLNNQLHRKLSLQRENHASRRWDLIYEREGGGDSFNSVEKKVLIADLWIEDNAIRFKWNEDDSDVVEQLGVPELRPLFNGVRWCLLEVQTEGKPPIILRLSNFEKIKQVRLVSRSLEHNHLELQTNGDENYVLPNGSLIRSDVELLNGSEDLLVQDSHEKLKHGFIVSCTPPSQKGAESSKTQPMKMLKIEIFVRPDKTRDESSISVTCNLLISQKQLDTIKRLHKEHGRGPLPRFEKTMKLSGKSSVQEYLGWIRNDGTNMLKQELDVFEKEREERKRQKQSAAPGNANGKHEEQKKRELRLIDAKLWCDAAIIALKYLQSASAKVSMSVHYSVMHKEYPVRILSGN